MEPASTIIDLLGGLSAVSEQLGLSVHTVKRWRYPKSKGGTDGFIPREHQFGIHASLLRHGFNITTEEIVYSPEQRDKIGSLLHEVSSIRKTPSPPEIAKNRGAA